MKTFSFNPKGILIYPEDQLRLGKKEKTKKLSKENKQSNETKRKDFQANKQTNKQVSKQTQKLVATCTKTRLWRHVLMITGNLHMPLLFQTEHQFMFILEPFSTFCLFQAPKPK